MVVLYSLSLAWRWLLSPVYAPGLFLVHCVLRELVRSLLFLCLLKVTLILSDQGPTLYDPLNLNCLPKAPFPNVITSAAMLQMWIWGGTQFSPQHPICSCFPSIYRNLLSSVFPFAFPHPFSLSMGSWLFSNFFTSFNLRFWKGKKVNTFGHFSRQKAQLIK